MKTSIALRHISSVKLGSPLTTIVTATDFADNEIEISIPALALEKLAGPLLCAAAIEASPQPRPPEGTELTHGCLLPILKWETGRIAINQEPTLGRSSARSTKRGYHRLVRGDPEFGNCFYTLVHPIRYCPAFTHARNP